MKGSSSHPRELEQCVLSILESRASSSRLKVCWEGEMEDFFKL